MNDDLRGPPPTEPPFASSTDAGHDIVLQRALASTSSGVTIVDMTQHDQPLIYVNAAFEQLTGLRRDELLGRNCRLAQGVDTDPEAVGRLRAAIDEGRDVRETLLNYRGPERHPWWNELHLSPVTDEAGQVVQYIGVQVDVTARVLAEQALMEQRELSRTYLARIEQLAFTDDLTGLMNRRRFEEYVEVALATARRDGTAAALLFLDLDRFKGVNDRFGHAAGDELLHQVAERLRSRIRVGDLIARLGGDEFLILLTHLPRGSAQQVTAQVTAALRVAVAEAVVLHSERVSVTASVGASLYPDDADTFGRLHSLADQRMYADKLARADEPPL